MSLGDTPESVFKACGVPYNTKCAVAFRKAMRGKLYGEEALSTAWAWFKDGWFAGMWQS